MSVTVSNSQHPVSGGISQHPHCNSRHGARRPTPRAADRLRRPALSAREIEVLVAWLHTDSKSEVARALFITTSTVNTHLTRMREKYANVGRPARTKVALAARAIQDGLIDLFDL